MRNKTMDWNVIGSRLFGEGHDIKVAGNYLHATVQFGGGATTAGASNGGTPGKKRRAIDSAERGRRRPIAGGWPRVLDVA